MKSFEKGGQYGIHAKMKAMVHVEHSGAVFHRPITGDMPKFANTKSYRIC